MTSFFALISTTLGITMELDRSKNTFFKFLNGHLTNIENGSIKIYCLFLDFINFYLLLLVKMHHLTDLYSINNI
jgi:hypothetical protein